MSFAESSERYSSQLNGKVASANEPVYMNTKADIIDYYRDHYPATGKGSWKQEIIKNLLPFTPQTGKDPAKNLAKRFDPQRRDNLEPKNAGQYAALGKTLPPIGVKPPKKGFKVTFNGRVKVSEGRRKTKGKGKKGMKGEMRGDGWTNASFSVKITGADALDFAENPNFDIVFAQYFNNFETNPVTDFSISSISVEPIE